MTVAVDEARGRTAATAGEGGAASHWLRPLIVGPVQRVRVVGLSGPACYLEAVDGTVLALETSRAGVALPNAVSLHPHGRGHANLGISTEGRLGGGVLRIRDRTVTVRRWWDPRPRTRSVEPSRLLLRRAELPSSSPAHVGYGLSGPVDDLRDAARRADSEAVVALVGDLLGRGPGSTPAGDDVLAGMLATLRTLGHADADAVRVADALGCAVRRALHRTGSLSATLLRCADDGAVVVAARRVLEALAGDTPLTAPVAELVRLGHTSGHDLLTGIGIAVDLLTAARS